MDLDRARRLAVSLMAEHGVSDYDFGFDRARRRQGLCVAPGRGRRGRITLSRHFVELNGEAEVRGTILHEIAHALVGPGLGHSAEWARVCRGIGGDPSVLGGGAMPQGRWRATCAGCGRTHSFVRRPKALTGWVCRQCGPPLGRLEFSRH